MVLEVDFAADDTCAQYVSVGVYSSGKADVTMAHVPVDTSSAVEHNATARSEATAIEIVARQASFSASGHRDVEGLGDAVRRDFDVTVLRKPTAQL